MKKFLVMAVAAVMAFAMQAAALQWTGTGADSHNKAVFGENNVMKSASIALVLHTNAWEGNLQMDHRTPGKIGLWSAGTIEVRLYGKGNALAGHAGLEGVQGGSIPKGAWASGPDKLADIGGPARDIYMGVIATNTDSGCKLDAYVNGVLIFSTTSSSKAENMNFAIDESDTRWGITEVSAYEGALTAEEMKWLADHKTSVLPEPTVLALLALGVAGLALKRKVA